MKILIIILLTIKCIYGDLRLDPLVLTPKGLIKGLQADDGDYSMFLGVPYAVVDESNPFGAAASHPGFNETFEAYYDNVACPQFHNVAMGTIQCLQLNIYVPNTAAFSNTLPVMVYLHGGSFVQGNKGKENLSPKFLIRHDVIIVTINYRLGPYGFLCITEPGFDNQGLKDQVLALRWIKDNIGPFGGDVNRITAFGQSAGAMSLDILLLNNQNLAHRAILQSGTALSPWIIGPKNNTIPISIAQKLGYNGDDVKAAIQYLSNKDSIEVIEAAYDLLILDFHGHPFTKPCIENIGDNDLLKIYPGISTPQVKGMDLMIGHTNKEVMFMYPNSDKEYYDNYQFGDELSKEFGDVYDEDTVRHFYIGDKIVSEELQSVILDYGSDFAFAHPAERTIRRYLNAGANRVYRYVFSYEGGRNRMKVSKNLTSEGASHGDDLGYLFGMTLLDNKTPDEDDQRIIDIMTTTWTNFAKYGDPTPSTSDLISEQWRPVDLHRRPFLNIDKPVTLESRPFYDRMAFWDLYYRIYSGNIKSAFIT